MSARDSSAPRGSSSGGHASGGASSERLQADAASQRHSTVRARDVLELTPTPSADVQLALPGVFSDEVEWVFCGDEEPFAMSDAPFVHVTVMPEAIDLLAPRAGGLYVDATLGGGGHTERLLESEPGARVIAVDRDPDAIRAAMARLERFGDRVTFVRSSFGALPEVLGAMGIAAVDGLFADLGVSSPQLDNPARGLSFRSEGPIDMRMDPDSGETALELIGRMDDDELANVLYQYGDERRSRRIARNIRRAYEQGELATTLDLRRAVVRAVGPSRVGGVDPATRTFQALRIAVNRELEELETLLAALPTLLAEGGIAAILSFHSLEDRLVKRAFQKDEFDPLFKKPRGASDEETEVNPRARSVKLRAAAIVRVPS